jgi:lysophospholipase
LIIHGKADGIVDYRGSEEVMQKAASRDKEIYIFDNLYHETMNETPAEREQVLQVIKTWLLKHI